METKVKALSLFKTCLFLVLSAIAINGYAYCSDAVYVGNQNRVSTIWVPGHYSHNGCWHEGYYIKFLCQPTCRDVVWVDGHYDKNGNWIPAHFKAKHYVVTNAGSEQNYVGFSI